MNSSTSNSQIYILPLAHRAEADFHSGFVIRSQFTLFGHAHQDLSDIMVDWAAPLLALQQNGALLKIYTLHSDHSPSLLYSRFITTGLQPNYQPSYLSKLTTLTAMCWPSINLSASALNISLIKSYNDTATVTFPEGITHRLGPSSRILEKNNPVTCLGSIVFQNHGLHMGRPEVHRSKPQTGQWSPL